MTTGYRAPDQTAMSAQSTTEVQRPVAGAWRLTELLPDADEATVAAAIADLERQVSDFESLRDTLARDLPPAALVDALRRFDTLVEGMYRLSGFSMLYLAADTRSEQALTLRSRVRDTLATLTNRTLFFTLWWKQLDAAAADRLLAALADEPDYHHYLADLRRLSQFSLDERSEQVVNLKNANGIEALMTIYSLATNRLEFRLRIDGEERIMTRDQVQSLVYSPRGEVREAAYRELFRVFESEAELLGQIYLNRVRDWHAENLRLRGYPSPIAVRNRANDVPDEAVDTLLEVTAESVGVFQRYFRLKAGWLGCDRLRRYDLYAPLAASDSAIPYGDAVELVLDTLGSFHPRLADLAGRVFGDQHIDAEIRSAKKSGAFCATILPHQTPWLLVNYTGKVRDVATLAHELGHAVHSMLAADHSVLTQQPSLPLAETASVFAEMLLTDRLLAGEASPRVRRELLASAVDDIFATVLRQAYFTRFEAAAHQAVLEGKPPSALDELYAETLRDQFGDAVDVTDEFRREWILIPHLFQSPFYCYAYSFGQLLVLALYQRYREQGEAFVPGYLQLLAHGGSARPQEILSEAGVDITDAGFWRGGVRLIERMVTELESSATGD